MNLNNRGWGLGMFLLLILIISVAIFFVWYSSVQINNRIGSLTKKNDYYLKLENDLVNSAGLFLNDNPINECYSIGCTINYDILKTNNYIDKFLDEEDHSECTGYVKVMKEVFLPYISCQNYKTGGYK